MINKLSPFAKTLLATLAVLLATVLPAQSVNAATTMQLASGWNMLGMSIQPENTAINQIFSGQEANITSLWSWSNSNWNIYLPASGSSESQSYATAKGFNLLTSLEAGTGFWLLAQNASSITVNGAYPTNASHTLASGWNLIALKGSKSQTLTELFAQTPPVSAWRMINGKWSIRLFSSDSDTQTYASAKGFNVLTDVASGEGFWVNTNSSISIDETPPTPGELKVMLQTSPGAYVPQQKAGVYVNGKLVTETDYEGLAKLDIEQETQATIVLEGAQNKTVTISPAAFNYTLLDQDISFDDVAFDAGNATYGNGSTKAETFVKLNNLYIYPLQTTVLTAKATPKGISDASSRLVVVDMALGKDITVAVGTFGSTNDIPDYSGLQDAIGAGSTVHLIGGADLTILDALASPITPQAAGFSGKVRTYTKANISNATLADMKSQVENGTGSLAMYQYGTVGNGTAWDYVGEAKINDNSGTLEVTGETGVYMETLNPFCFVFAGRKTINGTLADGSGKPVENVLVSALRTRENTTTNASGQFTIKVPDQLENVLLTLDGKGHYKISASVSMPKGTTTKDIGTVALTAYPVVMVNGTVTTGKGQSVANATMKLSLPNMPSTINLPKTAYTATATNGTYSFETIPNEALTSATLDVVFANGYTYQSGHTFNATGQNQTVNVSLVVPTWTFQTNGTIYGKPALVDGVLYATSADGTLYALNATTGAQLWAYKSTDYTVSKSTDSFFAGPTVTTEAVYATSVKNSLHGLATNGSKLANWGTMPVVVNSFAGDANTTLVNTPLKLNDELFLGSHDNNNYQFSASSGSLVAQRSSGSVVTAPVATDGASTYFVGDWGGYIKAFNTTSWVVDPIWTFPNNGTGIDGRMLAGPVYANGSVYVPGGNNLNAEQNATLPGDTNLYCLNAANGSLVWSYNLGASAVSSAVVTDNGTLYIADLNGTVHSIDITNTGNMTSNWTYTTGKAIYATPLLHNGNLYVGSEDTFLYCLNATTGTLQWKMPTGGAIASTAIADGTDNAIYAAGLDGVVYRIDQ